MKYDFTTVIDRRGHDALAVDTLGSVHWGNEPTAPKEGFSPITMWVADMNFATAPAVIESITARLQHPTFGYYVPREEYYESIIRWQRSRRGVEVPREAIGFETSVHGCITSAVNVLSEPGDAVLLHSPVYIGFKHDVDDLGRRSVYSELKRDENGVWRMDFADMERKICENNIRLAIFCSPHNPTGRVWERWEIEGAMEVFARHDVTVISDEIWADLVFSGHRHIPSNTVSDWARGHVLSIYALGKTFNLAGFTGAYHIIYDKSLRERIAAHSERTHFNDMHILSQYALLGAYSAEGEAWTEELLQVLEGNAKFACEYLAKNFPGVSTARPEGTYMLFLDCTEYCQKTGRSIDEVIRAGWDVGVAWQDGRGFGGPCHIRVNLASPRSLIEEAFGRMKDYVFLP